MRRVVLGLVVVVLVVVGIAGYMYVNQVSKEKKLEKLWEECRGDGFALVRYNGRVVKVEYHMHPTWKWRHGDKVWYCKVEADFLHPIKVNGTLMGGFFTSRTEFESKYLVKYLSNSTTPTALLENLNGDWISAGGNHSRSGGTT